MFNILRRDQTSESHFFDRRAMIALPAVLLVLTSLAVGAKDKSKVSNVFDAPPGQLFNAIYRYAQHNGTIKWSDESRFTLSGVMFVPGGHWDWQKHFDCTISVEPLDQGQKSAVDVVGTFPSKQQSLVGAFGEGPAVKVLRGIRAEFDSMTKSGSQPSPHSVDPQPAKASPIQPQVQVPSDSSLSAHIDPPKQVPPPPALSQTNGDGIPSVGAWSDDNPQIRHDGVRISGVTPGGPAAAIGLQPDDVILALNNRFLYAVDELLAEVRKHRPGDKIAIRYQRRAIIYDAFIVIGHATSF